MDQLTPIEQYIEDRVNLWMPAFVEATSRMLAMKAEPVMTLSAAASAEDEIFKHDFLCRGEGMLFVGSTGIGKSSFLMQGAFQWGLGRAHFGIQPARPLRTLIVQAENHPKEIAKERDGIIHGLGLSAEEIEALTGMVFTRRITSAVGPELMGLLRTLLSERDYDLLVLDPVNSYHGGDTNSQKDMSQFLRSEINKLLEEFSVGGILCHHTGKPKMDDKKGPPDFLKYAGAGSSEFGNWARGVWVLTPTAKEETFLLSAPKRGGCLGWRNEADEKIYKQFICHSGEEDSLGRHIVYWRQAEVADMPEGQEKQEAKTRLPIEQQIANLFAFYDERVSEKDLWARAKERGVKKPTFYRQVKRLKDGGLLISDDGLLSLAPGITPAPEIEDD